MNNLFLRCFTAAWCGPCKVLKPILEKLKDEHNIEIEYVDIEDNTELTQQYQIRSVPTLLFMENDKVLETASGLKPEKELLTLLENHKFINA